MKKYLYIFGYESPEQLAANDNNGWDDENSLSVFVEAESESEALAWGREISENFIKELFQDPSRSWKSMSYAHEIEKDPASIYSSDEIVSMPVVKVGQLPTW